MSSASSPATAFPGVVAIAPRVWIRRRRRTRRSGAYAVVWSVAFASIFFLPADHWHGSVADYVALVALFFGLPAIGLVFARRLFRAGLWMSSDGIVLRNPVRTLTLALNDVEAFVPGVAPGVGNGTPCPLLKQSHGPAVGVWALGRDGVVWRMRRYVHELQPLCDELNAVLHDLQS